MHIAHTIPCIYLLPLNTDAPQPENDVVTLAASLKSVVDERLAKHALPFTPRLFMENGRYMTGPFGWLVARCEVVKDTYAKCVMAVVEGK